MWDESKAKRGSIEIVTCLYDYFKLNHDKNHFMMNLDTCPGQNRNQFVAAMCLYAVRYLLHVLSIDHMFMVSGHSEMEVDSMHSMTERKSENLRVFSPTEWEIVVALASSKKSYTVNVLETEILLTGRM